MRPERRSLAAAASRKSRQVCPPACPPIGQIRRVKRRNSPRNWLDHRTAPAAAAGRLRIGSSADRIEARNAEAASLRRPRADRRRRDRPRQSAAVRAPRTTPARPFALRRPGLPPASWDLGPIDTDRVFTPLQRHVVARIMPFARAQLRSWPRLRWFVEGRKFEARQLAISPIHALRRGTPCRTGTTISLLSRPSCRACASASTRRCSYC